MKNLVKKNIISNEINYDYVDQCRNDESKCGKDGKYFEEDKYAHEKIILHKISNNIPIIISISIVVYSIIHIFEIFYLLTNTSFEIFLIIFSSFSKSLSPAPPIDSITILLN